MRYFRVPLAITVLGLLVAFFWSGIEGLLLTLMLGILEICLSFDNAIVNSSILRKMDKKWQTRFLSIGILISVFIVRFLLPILIVCIVANLSILTVVKLGFVAPNEYAKHLHQAQVPLAAFGGTFLFLVFLSFLLNRQKNVHWIKALEERLTKLRLTKSVEILITLLILLIAQSFLPESKKIQAIGFGVGGIVVNVLLNSLTARMSKNISTIKKTGILGFLYLEVLDATFSFDGVMGAFALTKDLMLIFLGLTIGAVFVRTFTVFLTEKGTLRKYRYLEHGAHYAIGALGVLMLVGMIKPVPEVVPGLIGICFIAFSLVSSILHNRSEAKLL